MKLRLDNLEEVKKACDGEINYDIEKLREDSIKDPKWLAFGSGNIFRGYIARIDQDLVNAGVFDRGISVAESFDFEIIDAVYKANDNLALSCTLHKDGKFDTNLIGTLVESLTLEDLDRIKEIFLNKNLQVVSFTITEKGYNLYKPNGDLMDVVAGDIAGEPKDAKHLMSLVAYLLYLRFEDSKTPVTCLSLDNCSQNGKKLQDSILYVAREWEKAGKVPADYIKYLEEDVAFPWSMIDKITPRPDKKVEEYLVKEKGFEDMDTVVTGKRSYVAPFVNSEEAEYLVIEDSFKNGRPPFEKAGVYMTDRETVNKVETMKVTTCLNPLHTALAVYGCLLGYESISSEMEDKDLVGLIKKIGYDEGLPVVVNPGILDPKDFIDEVIEVRLPNPFIPDTPQRIATDTSQKVSVRFGQTIKKYMEREDLDPKTLKYIPLALAGWLRYLLGVDDKGEAFELSPDPLMDSLKEELAGIEVGKFEKTEGLEKLLQNDKIFGVNLEEAGLADLVADYFEELSAGPGAVRKTLEKYVEA